MDIQTLKKSGRIAQVPIDEHVFYQGEEGKSAYFLLKGNVEVLVSSKGDGSLYKLADLTDGAVFGEMALLDARKRSATIRTTSDCIFLIIDESHFEKLVKQEPQMAHNLLLTMAERLNKLYSKLDINTEECNEESLIQTADRSLKPISVKKGDKLFCKGEYADTMAFVLGGSVIVSGYDELDQESITSIERGNLIGYSNLFYPGIRLESAEAIEDAYLIVIDKEHLEEFFLGYPMAFKQLVREISSEIRHFNEVLMLQESSSAAVGYEIIERDTEMVSKSKNPKKGAELFKGLNLNDYLARREITCPICGEEFEVLTIRHSKLRLKSITNEYRKIYNGFDELWYHIWACPKCRYHNYSHDYFNLSIKENYNLKRRLLKKKHNFRYIPKKKGNLNQVINEHYNLLLCKSLAESSALRQAKIWLHMAWLNDDADNTMERDEAYRKARKLYYDGWYESKDPLTLEEEQQLSILLAELYLKDGRLKEARQYLLRAVNKSGNKVFNRQAQNRMYDIREIMEDEKNKEVEANDEGVEVEVSEE